VSRSPQDTVRIEALGVPDNAAQFDFNFERWTSFCLRNSIVAPAECSFEMGDDTGWPRLSTLCTLGAEFVVVVDDRPRMVGRIEALSSPSDARQSTVQSFVVRTKMSDAMYASAPHGLHLKGASIKQFVVACYAAIGLREVDFDFRGDVSRDLMTGKPSQGGRAPVDLDPLTEEQAKVTPPESVFSAVDRHLRRHGLLHWDGPDGRIIVAKPDDTQEPLGALFSFRHSGGHFNNIVSINREQDVSQSPTALGVFGVGGGKLFSKAKVSALRRNEDLVARGFRRNVVIVDEGLRTKALAGSRANREFATRNRGLDRLDITVDGLAYKDGRDLLPWTPDTVIDVTAAQLGGGLGPYYIEEVEMNRSADRSDTSRLSLVKQGVWVL
jgi:prophage tail gpP-like protein